MKEPSSPREGSKPPRSRHNKGLSSGRSGTPVHQPAAGSPAWPEVGAPRLSEALEPPQFEVSMHSHEVVRNHTGTPRGLYPVSCRGANLVLPLWPPSRSCLPQSPRTLLARLHFSSSVTSRVRHRGTHDVCDLSGRVLLVHDPLAICVAVCVNRDSYCRAVPPGVDGARPADHRPAGQHLGCSRLLALTTLQQAQVSV